MKNEVLSSEQIYNKVDTIRVSKGWSIFKLAKEATISCNGIYNWRDRKSSPTLYLLECISDALEVSILNLIMDDNSLQVHAKEETEIYIKLNQLQPAQKKTVKELINQLLNITN